MSLPKYIRRTIYGFLAVPALVAGVGGGEIWDAIGKSVIYQGATVEPKKDSCVVNIRFRMVDRFTGRPVASVSLSNGLSVESLEVFELLKTARIGETVHFRLPLDLTLVPLGVYTLDHRTSLRKTTLDTIRVSVSEWPDVFKELRIASPGYDEPLEEAVATRLDVSALLSEEVGLALGRSPSAGDWIELRVTASEGSLEIKDGYSSSLTGRVEQQVITGGEVVWRHDIGAAPTEDDGWSVVSLKGLRSETVSVRVTALRNLGPWGWGEASRTWIRVRGIEHQ